MAEGAPVKNKTIDATWQFLIDSLSGMDGGNANFLSNVLRRLGVDKNAQVDFRNAAILHDEMQQQIGGETVAQQVINSDPRQNLDSANIRAYLVAHSILQYFESGK
jgi:hypothetical protein